VRKRKQLTIIFWLLVILTLIIYLIYDGNERRKEFAATSGRVVDQIYVTKRGKYRSYEVLCPQIRYFVNREEHFFVDHHVQFRTGSAVTVLYRKNNPEEAQVYTIRFWIDLGVVVPTLIISGFAFCIIWISLTNYGKKSVLLRGEFDEYPKGRT
jgi:hypothetical protein